MWYLIVSILDICTLTYFNVQHGHIFSVKQLKFEIYIIFLFISHLVLSSKNKNKFGEMDIIRLQFPLIKLWEVILNSVNLMYCVVYGIYTTLRDVCYNARWFWTTVRYRSRTKYS